MGSDSVACRRPVSQDLPSFKIPTLFLSQQIISVYKNMLPNKQPTSSLTDPDHPNRHTIGHQPPSLNPIYRPPTTGNTNPHPAAIPSTSNLLQNHASTTQPNPNQQPQASCLANLSKTNPTLNNTTSQNFGSLNKNNNKNNNTSSINNNSNCIINNSNNTTNLASSILNSTNNKTMTISSTLNCQVLSKSSFGLDWSTITLNKWGLKNFET